MTNSLKGKSNLKVITGGAKSRLEDDLNDLFKLPLSEFIGARKNLATRLKKEGRTNEADQVRALTKPSISAWTVNQLYWKHREPFDQLIATGHHIRQAQKVGKVDTMRAALEARREVLARLSDMANALLRDAGHNPTLDMTRRIATTFEAMSAYAALPDGHVAGRLITDIDPPGFDSLASFIPAAGTKSRIDETKRVGPASKLVSAAVKTLKKSKSVDEAGRIKEMRQAKLAAAKATLQEAKKSLVAARANAQRLEATLKKAEREAKEAERVSREAERRFSEARASSEAAERCARSIAAEVREAANALDKAQLMAEKASKELESIFRD